MVSLVKNHVENGLSNLFDLQGQTIDVSDQAVFILNIQVFMIKKEKNQHKRLAHSNP